MDSRYNSAAFSRKHSHHITKPCTAIHRHSHHPIHSTRYSCTVIHCYSHHLIHRNPHNTKDTASVSVRGGQFLGQVLPSGEDGDGGLVLLWLPRKSLGIFLHQRKERDGVIGV